MKHIVDEYKDWQPKYASYEINKFPKKQAQAQAVKEMVCEAGEVLAIITKADRKDKPYDRLKVLDEAGDTFWGLCGIMNQFDITFKEMIEFNMDKLDERNN